MGLALSSPRKPKIYTFVSLCGGNALRVAVLTDEGKGDKNKLEQLRKNQVLQAGHVHSIADFSDHRQTQIPERRRSHGEELRAVATDIAELGHKIMSVRADMEGGFFALRTELRDIRHRLDALDEQYENIKGVTTESERHLGIDKRIAA